MIQNGRTLTVEERELATRMGMELARTIRAAGPAANKAPFRHAVLASAAYLLGDEAVIAAPTSPSPAEEEPGR
jgi:hypothetical protein